MTVDSPELSPIRLERLRAQLQAGERDAQFRFAEACEHGWGVPQSVTAARRWYRAAARQGEAEAAFRLGLLWLRAERRRADIAGAAWMRQAADAGHGDAQAVLATCYRQGRGIAADLGESLRWTEQAARNGSARGRCDLALCYRAGSGVARNMTRAVELLTQAASQGYARAQLMLGHVYANGDGVSEDPTAARHWYAAGARQGYVKARYNLALLLLADGDPGSDRKALDELRVAAAAGYAKAMYLLATNYRRGIGGPADHARAQIYLHKAAAAGLAKAQYRLARQSDRATVDGERSYWQWIRRAAAGGHARAQYLLGAMIMSVPPAERGTALNWLNRAAEGGEKRAAYMLAVCYARGHGVEQNAARAYRWMLVARAAGYERAVRQSKRLAQALSPRCITAINLDVLAFTTAQAEKRARRRLRIE